MSATDFFSAGALRPAINPAAVAASTAVDGVEIDTLGSRWAIFSLQFGAIAGAGDWTFKVQAANASGGAFVDVPRAVFAPDAGNDANTSRLGVIDTHRFGRYLKIVGTTGAGGVTNVSATCALYGISNTAEILDRDGLDAVDFEILAATV